MQKRIQVGDLVIRRSHGGDLVFQVVQIDQNSGLAILRCRDFRLMADAPLDDLEIYEYEYKERSDRLREKNNYLRKDPIQELIQRDYVRRKEVAKAHRTSQFIRTLEEYYQIRGKVLQIDGDSQYLEKCMTLYNEIKVKANGYYISEEKQSIHIQELLSKHRPDILVITGHDGMQKTGGNDINDYHTSRYFVESVLKAREWEPNKDGLIIFAGACQSYYEALIEAGANFASSPKRINIHTLDPVRVVEVIAKSSFKEVVPIEGVIHNSITGVGGIGGIESMGKMRLSLPKISCLSKQNNELCQF